MVNATPLVFMNQKLNPRYDPDNTTRKQNYFSLCELRAAANLHFNTTCTLRKLAEGGYHKVLLYFYKDNILTQVYEIFEENGASLGITHVAVPTFLKDKLE